MRFVGPGLRFRRANSQQIEPAGGVGKASCFGVEDFIENCFADQPGGHAGAQAAGCRSTGAPQGGVKVEDRFAVGAGGKNSNADGFMSPIDRQQHRFRRHGIGLSRADHDFPRADSADQNYMRDRNTVLFSEPLDTLRQPVAVFQTNHEHAADPALRYFHGLLPTCPTPREFPAN